ncbi:MAG: Fic family protein [Acetobacteraceae bacterium]|nr:Fic family protein [Acetobacteraceae bacterium]
MTHVSGQVAGKTRVLAFFSVLGLKLKSAFWLSQFTEGLTEEGGTPGQGAEFVPPPVPEMQKALHDFERYYHEGPEPALVKCGLLHAQFETIHPFLDGNGGVGRLLINLFLRESNVLQRPLLYLGSYSKTHRRGYYDALMAVRNKGTGKGG